MRRTLVVAIVVLLAASTAVAGLVGGVPHAGPPVLASRAHAPVTPVTTPAVPVSTSTTPPVTSAPAPAPPPTLGPATLAGCPPPVRPPPPPPPPPWHPAVLVPESSLPPAPVPAPWQSDLAPITGKGMWVWQLGQTEGGDVAAIVQRAQRAHLHQLWVRVADSRDGFYGAAELAALVGAAHHAGLAVIGWGFPYLYDPVGDAGWTAQVLNWRGPRGDRLDGFSADIEKSTEGVALSERRAAVYLGTVRRAAGDRLLVATVYRPVDANWVLDAYPYASMARYVDAFAPMVYWGCTDPGEAASQSLARLASLRPVHLIGQAYNMGSEGGRDAAPSAAETVRFLQVGELGGALGASFWSWQAMSPDEWTAMSAFAWHRPAAAGPGA